MQPQNIGRRWSFSKKDLTKDVLKDIKEHVDWANYIHPGPIAHFGRAIWDLFDHHTTPPSRNCFSYFEYRSDIHRASLRTLVIGTSREYPDTELTIINEYIERGSFPCQNSLYLRLEKPGTDLVQFPTILTPETTRHPIPEPLTKSYGAGIIPEWNNSNRAMTFRKEILKPELAHLTHTLYETLRSAGIANLSFPETSQPSALTS